MYRNIAVPVDLEHVNRLEKALATAADLAKHYNAEVCYIGVTTTEPSPLGHTPDEYAQSLAEFGRQQAAMESRQRRLPVPPMTCRSIWTRFC